MILQTVASVACPNKTVTYYIMNDMTNDSSLYSCYSPDDKWELVDSHVLEVVFELIVAHL